MAMTRQEVRDLILSFPHTEEGTVNGRPAFRAFGKVFTRIRDEDDSIGLPASFDEREMLMAAAPETFHITPHYQSHPAVLARLSSVEPGTVRVMLERRWRALAPKKLLKELEASRST